jgi:hypothetical protein
MLINSNHKGKFMKQIHYPALCLLISLGVILRPLPVEAKAKDFVCSTQGKVPTTVALMDNGKKVPLIYWVSEEFSSDGWTPLRRCQAVSARFYEAKDNLRYLTTGEMNGMNTICTALTVPGTCDKLIYTLKRYQSPTNTLSKLIRLRNRAGGPLNEVNGQEYIDMNKLLGLGDSEDLPPMSTNDPMLKWSSDK